MFVQFTSEDAETKHCHICFYKDLATSFNTWQNDATIFLNNILPANKIKKKWMPQNKVVKSTACTHWSEKRNFTSFYILGLFQTTTANVAIEKKIFNDDALFEGAICQDFRLTLCTVVCKRLGKCGSCHIVSKTL